MAGISPANDHLSYAAEPDVYETAAVPSDDESASQKDDLSQSPVDSGSDTDDADAAEDGPFGAVSRRSLFPARARSRFQALGSKVDAKGLDLSDRVDGRRRGLRMRYNTAAGSHDDESLHARIARLRREVEECRAQARDPEAQKDASNATAVKEVEELGKMLAELESSSVSSEVKQLQDQQQQQRDVKAEKIEEEQLDGQTLDKIAVFDTRLSTLERALGIASLDMAPDGSFTSPVLPSIELLDQQISALMTSASIAQLDATSSRVRKLAQEAEQLSTLRSVPPPQEDGEGTNDEPVPTTFSQEDVAKLNSLYSLIPVLQSLSPTVPALLERLRSLTALHTGAASAANALDQVEKRQADTDAELKSWTEGLKRVESVVNEASEANGRNGKMVQGWVKDLETRVKALR